MRLLSLRLIVALIVGVTVVSLALSWHETRAAKNSLRRDLEYKAEILDESLAVNAELYLQTGDISGLDQMAQRYSNRDHLIGIGIYGRDGSTLAITHALTSIISEIPQPLEAALSGNRAVGQFVRLHFTPLYVRAAPLHSLDRSVEGGIVVVHDATYIRAAIFRIWGGVFIHIAIQMLVIVGITLLIVYWSLSGPIRRAAQWMKALRTGRHGLEPSSNELDFLMPLVREVAPLAESMRQARAAAETEARLRNSNDSLWTAQRLADHV
ncbi:MAG: trehalose-6-phosphate synthase, partial [Acidobacteriota bacterium]